MVSSDVVSFRVVAGLDVNGGRDWCAEGVVQFMFDRMGDVVTFFDGEGRWD